MAGQVTDTRVPRDLAREDTADDRDGELGAESAMVVGHDWGGIVAWQFAMNLPQMTENLVILNLPHPQGLSRELRINPEQIKNSEYARNFQQKMPDDPTVFFGRPMTAEKLRRADARPPGPSAAS